MSVPSEVTYLDADGVGVSPVPGYPGTITFPVVMTLPMHKEWQARVNARGEEASDAPRIGIAFNQAAEESERLAFLYDDVVLGLHFGKLAVTGPNKKKITEKTPEAELPLPVAVWVAKAYREWENSQLLFRWDRNAGVAVSNGAE